MRVYVGAKKSKSDVSVVVIAVEGAEVVLVM